jgi:hypothetical protein
LFNLETQTVDGAFKIMQKKQLSKLAPSYGTCRFLSDLIKAATWVSYPHDTEKEGFSVSPEDEPTSSSKDTWARSAGWYMRNCGVNYVCVLQ